jgi:adenylate cyclase
MNRAMLIDFDNLDMRYNFACMLAAQMGDKDGALRLLQRNFSAISAYQLKVADADPDLDSLRDDSRFVNMVERARSRLGVNGSDIFKLAKPSSTAAQ